VKNVRDIYKMPQTFTETKKCPRRKVLAFRKFPASFKNRMKFEQNYFSVWNGSSYTAVPKDHNATNFCANIVSKKVNDQQNAEEESNLLRTINTNFGKTWAPWKKKL